MVKKLNLITLLIILYSVSVCSYFDYTRSKSKGLASKPLKEEKTKHQISASVTEKPVVTLFSVTTRK